MTEPKNDLRELVVSDVLGVALAARNLLRKPEMLDLWLEHLKDLLDITEINIVRAEERVMHQGHDESL